jgi:hypothetical protein
MGGANHFPWGKYLPLPSKQCPGLFFSAPFLDPTHLSSRAAAARPPSPFSAPPTSAPLSFPWDAGMPQAALPTFLSSRRRDLQLSSLPTAPLPALLSPWCHWSTDPLLRSEMTELGCESRFMATSRPPSPSYPPLSRRLASQSRGFINPS